MKKILIAVLFIMLSLSVTSSVHAAITVSGSISPSDEWDTWFIHGTDPNESNISDNYDIKELYAWWDDDNVYIRTDVYGIPTLEKQDSNSFGDEYYQWTIDTTGDEVADLYLVSNLVRKI